MIKAFGTLVVRGNYVVGAVVFLVLTTIQFIVIAEADCSDDSTDNAWHPTC